MEKIPYKSFLGKLVVTKDGRRLGLVKDITFEVKTGEVINLILKDLTEHAINLSIEKTKNKEALIPFHSVIAIGDFIVVSEEDFF
ncbi:MAG: PRC-barrel domain-containing protein [Candidatus Pacearchaeota archaeon]